MSHSPTSEIFEHLFVLELANNHQGKLQRGLRIVRDFSRIVRFNNVKAAIKLQFRDVDAFIHRDFRERAGIRYIKRTLDTRLSKLEYATLTNAIRQAGCITMATPFDEVSVELCVELGIELIKIA
ncbi:MAG TPA: N-acetylneuraminate synthase family protein, partial [Candidatus Accumulibacter phosphatis]|nr:N-acetylneuraminate synthase family protein [Candidatus Accumulibacter phosphatis]